MDLSKLPPWALPVGAGALLGGAVLLTRGNTAPSVPLPITGQNPGTVEESEETRFNQLTKLFTDLFTANAEAQAERDAAQNEQTQTFFENLISLQSGNMEDIAELIGSQNSVITAQNKTFMDALKAWQESIAAQLKAIAERPADTGSTTVVSILEQYKNKFKTAFERVGEPFGTRVPNSDIIEGTLPTAPYAQDKGFTYYGTTGHYVTGPFRQWLGNKGGARTWGRPMSQVFRDADGRDTQVFERVILKYVPGSNPSNYDIIEIPLF